MLAANLKAVLDRTPGERIVIIAQWPDGTRSGAQAFDLHSCETVHVTNHRGETVPMLALVVGAQAEVSGVATQTEGAN